MIDIFGKIALRGEGVSIAALRGATVQVVCGNKRCKCTFTARVADRKRGWAKFCSKSCKAVVQEKHTGQHASYKSREHSGHCNYDDLGWDSHKDRING